MPSQLNSDREIAARKSRIRQLRGTIEQNNGEEKEKIIALFMYSVGVKKSVTYEYLKVLVDAGLVVEQSAFGVPTVLWTKQAWAEHEVEMVKVKARAEADLTKNNSLDAYSLEST